MHETDGWSLVVLGLLLLGGYVAHVASRRAAVPKVTVLLVIGAVCGPSVLDLVPQRIVDWFPFVSQIALAMIGFLLGESFAGKHLKETGPVALVVSVAKSLAAAAAVLLAVRAAGGTWLVALLLAGIAPASAPAAVFETVRGNRARGVLSDTVLEIVAIDDAWGILIFSVMLVIAGGVAGGEASAGSQILDGLWQVGGAAALGVVLGLPMAWITGTIRGGEPTLVEAGGFVLLCAGVAEVLGVSYLLATMTLGTVVANRASGPARPFHAIEGVREPFLAIFFLLAGFKFDVSAIAALGLIGLAYVLARAGAFVAASWASARTVRASPVVRRRIGWCLLPQAGVALGLALLAEQAVPAVAGQVLPLVIATTILFEVIGPIVLRLQLKAAGEIEPG